MIKKIFIGFLVFIVLLIGGLVASTFIFKDKINEIVKKQINNGLNASVDYGDYDLSIISSFPDFRFSLNDLVVVGKEKFEGDTLALIKELNFDLDAKKLYQKRALDVNSIYVNELNLKNYILADSSNSLHILKNKVSEETKVDTSSERVVNINIESLVVENSNILYHNELTEQEVVLKDIDVNAAINYIEEKITVDTKSSIAGVYYANAASKQVVSLEDLKFDAVADYVNNLINVETKTNVASSSFTQDDTKFLNKANLVLDGTVNANLEDSKYTVDQNIGINDVKLDLKGDVQTKDDDILLDLDFASNKSTFKAFLSLIPEKYLKDYKNVDVKGGFVVNGTANGVYNNTSFPAFDINMAVDNGYFKYPTAPTALENINFKASVKNTSPSMNDLALNVPKASLTLEGEPIDFKLKMTELKNDLYADLDLQGKINLAKVLDLYPIEDVTKLAGNVDADVAFKGKLSDVENKKFEAVDFQGDMKINDLVYESKKVDMPVRVKTMNLDFTPRYANMTNLDMTYGKSDFKANGKLENLINYVLADGTVKGNLNLSANKVDLTEIMGEEKSAASESSEEKKSESIRVPKNIDFTANANIKELLYDDIELSNLKGGLKVKDEQLNVKSIQANLLGGNAKINGVYSTQKPGKPAIDFKYDIKNFDIKQTFEKVNTIEKIAPIAQYLDGKFNSTFAFNSLLEDNFMPDLTMLNGLGDVKISYANFLNLPIFKSINNVVKVPLLNNLDKAAIKDAWTVFKIEDGKVNVEPFDYQYQDIKLSMFGSNGFDKSIDYTMKLTVPSNKFGNAASVANDWLSKQNIPLLNLAVPQNLTFHLNLSGFLNKPNVKIVKVTADKSDKGVVEQITSGVVDKAKEEAERLRKQAEQKAREEAERIKKEIEQKAKQEADRLAKEAAEKAQKEAEKILNDALKDKLPNFGF